MKFLRDVLNLVLVNFMVLSILRLFLIIHAGLSLSFHTKTVSRSQRSKVVYKAGCWDCDSFYVGKTKRRLHDRKTEHFKALTQDCHASALADHVIGTFSTDDFHSDGDVGGRKRLRRGRRCSRQNISL